MPLNRDARLNEIDILKKDDTKNVGKHKIEWNGEAQYMDVYRIPIKYLVYNKYNGRILSRTKSLETQKKKIDIESKEGFEKVEKLLFDSHPTRNRRTEKSIKEKGQEKPGIITKDGVVIDGNRRFMFLNRLAKSEQGHTERFKHFEAVILPVSLADDPDQIRQLETSYQMGEDKKLDYNPIEKYLKAQELKNANVQESDIASWMGEAEGEIKKYLDTMAIMDDYLDTLEYEGIYTQLDGREDWFLSLTKWLENLRKGESNKGFDGYKQGDVDDLQCLCYDYIRAKHGGDGKRFRKIAEGLKDNHIFSNKNLWKKFKDSHFEQIKKVKDEETDIDYNHEELKKHLDARDNQFIALSEDFLKENLDDRISELSNKQNHDKPEKLINKANSALQEVSTKANSFSKTDTQKQLKKLHKKVNELLLKNDISLVLEQSLNLLESIDSKDLNNQDENQLKLIAKINKLSFDIKKELGG